MSRQPDNRDVADALNRCLTAWCSCLCMHISVLCVKDHLVRNLPSFDTIR